MFPAYEIFSGVFSGFIFGEECFLLSWSRLNLLSSWNEILNSAMEFIPPFKRFTEKVCGMQNVDKGRTRLSSNPVLIWRLLAKSWARRCLGTSPAGQAKGRTVPLNPHQKWSHRYSQKWEHCIRPLFSIKETCLSTVSFMLVL